MAKTQLARYKLKRVCKVEDGFIVLDIKGKKLTYDIPLNECKTPEHILQWTLQLLEKKWASKLHLEQFILQASHENGIKIYP